MTWIYTTTWSPDVHTTALAKWRMVWNKGSRCVARTWGHSWLACSNRLRQVNPKHRVWLTWSETRRTKRDSSSASSHSCHKTESSNTTYLKPSARWCNYTGPALWFTWHQLMSVVKRWCCGERPQQPSDWSLQTQVLKSSYIKGPYWGWTLWCVYVLS